MTTTCDSIDSLDIITPEKTSDRNERVENERLKLVRMMQLRANREKGIGAPPPARCCSIIMKKDVSTQATCDSLNPPNTNGTTAASYTNPKSIELDKVSPSPFSLTCGESIHDASGENNKKFFSSNCRIMESPLSTTDSAESKCCSLQHINSPTLDARRSLFMTKHTTSTEHLSPVTVGPSESNTTIKRTSYESVMTVNHYSTNTGDVPALIQSRNHNSRQKNGKPSSAKDFFSNYRSF
jgi:hypothetical protein